MSSHILSPEMLEKVQNSNNRNSPSGCMCRFIKIDDSWGIKAYRHLESRNRSFSTQKKMAEVGFGPQVGECFDVGGNYCFITQVATPLVEPLTGEQWERMTFVEQEKRSDLFTQLDNNLEYQAEKKSGS